ncbi:MAG: SH3 domain-containing protein [Caldilinea sp.]|nr:SH3 domain-containing protein [Caldilinea sp.]MDW8441088.1 SH3 domain-containing protein [Caldilineaceae bacterium]
MKVNRMQVSRMHRSHLLGQTVLRRKLWMAFVLAGAIFWGGAQVWAADGVYNHRQTIPPPPTATPTPQPPTPTPRPPRPTPRPETSQGGAPASAPTQTTSPSLQPTMTLTATVNVVALNVRQGPGTTFPVIGRLTQGTSVTLQARNPNNNWLKICCVSDAQTQGWVNAQFLIPRYTEEELVLLPVEGDAPASQRPANAPTGAVSAPVLNVRAEPSTESEILGKFASGTTVSLLGRNAEEDWWLVCCLPNEVLGWVAARFITVNATEAELAALPVLTSRDTFTLSTSSTLSATLIGLTVQPWVQAIQEQPVALSFTVVNLGETSATDVQFSFELPAGLSFVSASATDGGEVMEEVSENGTSVIVVAWPELAVGVNALVNINVVAESDLPNGTVLDGAAVAQAANAESTYTSVLVGLPPAEPPDFW